MLCGLPPDSALISILFDMSCMSITSSSTFQMDSRRGVKIAIFSQSLGIAGVARARLVALIQRFRYVLKFQ